MSTIRNEALTLNLLSFCPQDQRVPTRLRTFCLWNQCKKISSAVSPQRSAADSNARLQFTFSSISKAPEQLEVLSLSWCIVCLKEKTQQTGQLVEIFFFSKIREFIQIPGASHFSNADLLYCYTKPDWYTKSHSWPLVQKHLAQWHEKVHYICTQ